MNPEILFDEAHKLLISGDHGGAYKLLQKLDRAIPNNPNILYLLGTCQSLGGKKTNAVSSYLRVIKLQPSFIEAYNNLGLDLNSLGRHQEALDYFDMALKIRPNFLEAALNRANTLISVHRLNDAISELELLLNNFPNTPSILANIGNAFFAATKYEGALRFYEKALVLTPADAKILGYKISTLEALKRWEDCISVYGTLPPNSPEAKKTKATAINALLKINDWAQINYDDESLEKELGPLAYLYCCKKQSSQLSNSRLYARKYKTGERLPPTNNKRIKIGYISADFRNHPVGYLTAGVFQAHNKSEFEIICFSTCAPDDSKDAISQRIQKNCDQFIHIDQLGNDDAINLIRSFGLDIAFDLAGYTAAARTALFAARVAPIQISYLGFPGGMGATYIDYLIGDPIVTPKSLYPFYQEKIIALPESFQANDDARTIIATNRKEQKLPKDALVLACFNQSSKITPRIFGVWMNALRQGPHAILWLAKECATQEKNLRLEAKKAGIDPERLHFAERLPYENHLGRYELVDLALDTAPFNGGTTSSDALWVGAPVLTLCGETYANRMGASLLHALALDTLITESLDAYESKLITLINNPQELNNLKNQLNASKRHASLFNTKKFTKQLEAGLKNVVKRNRLGLTPDHINVQSIA